MPNHTSNSIEVDCELARPSNDKKPPLTLKDLWKIIKPHLINMTLDKTIKLALLIGIIIVAGYFAIFLPVKDQQRQHKLDQCLKWGDDYNARQREYGFEDQDLCFKRFAK